MRKWNVQMFGIRSRWPDATSNDNNKKNFVLVEDIGFEPMTPCVQGRCSSQLS